MELTDKDLDEFIAIWQKEFGEVITRDRARFHGGRLLELYALLMQPLPGEQALREDSATEDHVSRVVERLRKSDPNRLPEDR